MLFFQLETAWLRHEGGGLSTLNERASEFVDADRLAEEAARGNLTLVGKVIRKVVE